MSLRFQFALRVPAAKLSEQISMEGIGQSFIILQFFIFITTADPNQATSQNSNRKQTVKKQFHRKKYEKQHYQCFGRIHHGKRTYVA